MYASIKDLTPSLQSALNQLGYYKKDISIEASETVDISSCAGDGSRGFYAIVSLDGSIATEIHYGSWGGANMFETRRVDIDTSLHTMIPGAAVITGTAGNHVYARITLHPSNIAAMLPAKTEITPEQKSMLESYSKLKPAYRPKYSQERIQELVNLGLLKQSKNGATQITTAGKNAIR